MLEQLQQNIAQPQVWLALLFGLGVTFGVWLLVRLMLRALERRVPYRRAMQLLRVLWHLGALYLAFLVAVHSLGLSTLEPFFSLGGGLVAWAGASVGRVVAVLAFAYVALLGVDALAERIADGAEFNRRTVRARTLKSILRSSLRGVVYVLAALEIAQALGINATTLLAGVSIVGIAVSFGAQSLVRDVLNGFFILLEDQYGVGDVITVNGNEKLSGGVERLTLRVTQLRALDGQVHIIPNGQINQVSVASKEWSRLVGDVLVSHEAGVEASLEALGRVADSLYQDPRWQEVFLEAPEIVGMVGLETEGVKLRALFKVRPKEQWALGREFYLRIKREFARARLPLAGQGVGAVQVEEERS